MEVSVGSSIYNAPSIYESGAGRYGGGDYERGFETIKGKKYNIVKIGNYWWTCENLDYTPNNIPLVNLNDWATSGFVAQIAYYNDDPVTSKKLNLGALYSYGAVLALMNDLDGWEIPTKNSWDDFISNCYGIDGSGAGVLSKAIDYTYENFPTNWNGINYNYMNILPAGILDKDYDTDVKRYSQLNVSAYFWMYYSSTVAYRIYFGKDTSLTDYLLIQVNLEYTGRSLRLCKHV